MASSSVGKAPNITNNFDVEDDCPVLQNLSIVRNIATNETVELGTKKAKTLTSNVWNFFVKIGVSKDGKEKYKCKTCGNEYTCASGVGTSHLSRHIPKCRMTSH